MIPNLNSNLCGNSVAGRAMHILMINVIMPILVKKAFGRENVEEGAFVDNTEALLALSIASCGCCRLGYRRSESCSLGKGVRGTVDTRCLWVSR